MQHIQLFQKNPVFVLCILVLTISMQDLTEFYKFCIINAEDYGKKFHNFKPLPRNCSFHRGIFLLHPIECVTGKWKDWKISTESKHSLKITQSLVLTNIIEGLGQLVS